MNKKKQRLPKKLNPEVEKISEAVANILKVKTNLKQKKLRKVVQGKQLFIDLIKGWNETLDREVFMMEQLGTDLSEHNSAFYSIISKLITLKFETEISELIHFFIYERHNADGSINSIVDKHGNQIKLETEDDLWNLIIKINPSFNK